MYKNYFHNNKHANENKDNKMIATSRNLNHYKKVVNINKLLNRVRIEKKNDIKKKIIIYSTVSALMFLFGIFIV
jgi:hypothetical protein